MVRLFAVCDSGGMSEIGNNFEDDPRKLYVPENTQGAQDESLILSEFGLPNAIASVYGTSDPRGGNMLTTDNVLTVRFMRVGCEI